MFYHALYLLNLFIYFVNILLFLRTVKSNDLEWLPNGSEFLQGTENSASNTSGKQKTYTSFSCSQDSLPEFSSNPIITYRDITLARLGPGQVRFELIIQ